MKIVYEAFDGTLFDNEFECSDYERENAPKDFYNRIVALNEKLQRISAEDIDGSFYLHIKDEDVLSKYADACEYYGYTAPAHTGRWMYANGTWVDLNIAMLDARNHVEELNDIYLKLAMREE